MKIKERRPLDLVVISDTHLGTVGAHAQELFKYLKSIEPKTLIINGDFIDIWQFSKRHWDEYHTKIIKQLMTFISKGVKIHYIVGNHDESFRRFLGFSVSGFSISNKLTLNLNGKKTWFFHGDVFDVTMQHSRWLTRLGGFGYDFLIIINRIVNLTLSLFGIEKLSFSKAIKNKVKGAVASVNKFEETVVDIASRNDFDYVVCGHIHQAAIKEYLINDKKTTYLNSGDWIENLTSLEYNKGEWCLHTYDPNQFTVDNKNKISDYKTSKELYQELVNDFKML